jgi:hypothetical protein
LVEELSAQTLVKTPVISAAKNLKRQDDRQYLTSWKEIAAYMRCGVRTVQRYEREFGLPVRRPTGKLRGAVMATRAEIDAWVAAGPIRKAFQLVRVEQNSRTRSQTNKIEDGVIEMGKLKEQMRELCIETRTALNLLRDRVSSLRLLMPPARPNGYEPLVNMDIGMDVDGDRDMEMRGHAVSNKGTASLNLANPIGRRRIGGRTDNKSSLSPPQKPH